MKIVLIAEHSIYYWPFTVNMPATRLFTIPPFQKIPEFFYCAYFPVKNSFVNIPACI